MVAIYKHRINTLAALAEVPPTMGIEFDLRSDGQRVIVTHDPFTDGPTIEEFFPHIGKRPCIFNVKCEGIEARIAELAKANGIENYFMLDLSVPAAVKLTRIQETRMAVRYSEIEPIESVMAWKGKASWVWVDCFNSFPGDAASWAELSKHFKLCLVSPELQSHTPDNKARLIDSLRGRSYHAVCTKVPADWESVR